MKFEAVIFDCDGVLVNSEALDADRQSQPGEALPDQFESMVEDERRCVYATELKPIAGVAAFVAAMAMPKAVASSARIEALARNLRLTTLHDLFAPHIYSAE